MYDRAEDENSFVSNPSWIFHTTLTTYKSSSDPRVHWLLNDLCCHILGHAQDFSGYKLGSIRLTEFCYRQIKVKLLRNQN